nr:MAG TPA: hypothetical protein [Caudoviricetes sp.]DAS17688.1 MAG TPA: hypothetical protein [Caudoviricetes sp.]
MSRTIFLFFNFFLKKRIILFLKLRILYSII